MRRCVCARITCPAASARPERPNCVCGVRTELRPRADRSRRGVRAADDGLRPAMSSQRLSRRIGRRPAGVARAGRGPRECRPPPPPARNSGGSLQPVPAPGRGATAIEVFR